MALICFQGGPQDGVTGEFELPEQAKPGLRVQRFTGAPDETCSGNWYALTDRHVRSDAGLAIVATYLGRDLQPAQAHSRGLSAVPAED
jgi:hypothetical protein